MQVDASVDASPSHVPTKPRLWPAVLAWLVYAPVLLFSVAIHWITPSRAWFFLLAGWFALLAWLLASHYRRYGQAFTRVHALGVCIGYLAGSAIAACVGIAALFALFGQLPTLASGG